MAEKMDAILQDDHVINHTLHPEAQWFPEAHLGLFLHWGVSVMDENPDRSCEISWCLMKHRLPGIPEDVVSFDEYYGDFARRFNPQNYDPDRWLAKAAESGFRYAVLTTRHHDGFAMWPSRYGELSTKNFMGGRDLVRPFVEACRRNGLKVGLYYSPLDWYYFRKYNKWDHNYCWDPYESWLSRETPKELLDAHAEYCHNQVKELLTNYGKIDLMWFDGGSGEIKNEFVRNLQPGIVINSRLGGGEIGDFSTPECAMPAERPNGWWEYCDIWNNGPWSWTLKEGETYRSAEEIFGMYKTVRDNGGNLLINCAPRPDGKMPDAYYRRMDEFRELCEKNGYGNV